MFDEMIDQKKMLRNAFGCFASGVTVVTLTDDDGRPTGITVNSFSSLSLDPPLCLFSVGKEQVSCKWFETRERFVINVLSEAQEPLAWQFAKPLPDKFQGVEWHKGASGVPVLTGSMASFECKKWATYDGGDHVIIVGQVTEFDVTDGDALLFFKGQMGRLAE